MNRFKASSVAATFASGLALSGCATLEEAAIENTAETYETTLAGAQVPGTGDPDGYATAEVSVADRLDQICYDVNNIRNLAPITGIHIHHGVTGASGPIVLTLKQANEGGWKGCTSRSEWVEDTIEEKFSVYYFDIHTTEYPNGAIRGQLGQ